MDRDVPHIPEDRPAEALREQDRLGVDMGTKYGFTLAQAGHRNPDFGQLVCGGKFVHE